MSQKFTYEVRPCCAISDLSGIEECQPEEAEFWGVYERVVEPVDDSGFRPAYNIADFQREVDARLFVKTMTETP